MPDTVICLDFDGTLVDSQGRIHPADVEILARESSVLFVPATGRLKPSVRRTFDRNGLFAGRPIPFPMVLHNGAALYGPCEALVARQALPRDVQDEAIERMLSHAEIGSFLFGLDEVFLIWASPFAEAMSRRFELDAQPFAPACRKQAYSKLMCVSPAHAPLQRFAAELAHLPLELTFSLPTVLEINEPGVDKGRGLATLLEKLGLAHARLVVAGDGENDLPLFERAALAFAPSSSPAAIQARAGHIIDVRQNGLLAPILDAI